MSSKPDPKLERLRQDGALNLHAELVRAPWFAASEFFDARDLVQTKYEMLRHVRADGVSKAEAAAVFGLSRPTYYQAEAAFARAGLAGLLPRQRGPKDAHKLNSEVMAFIDERRREGGAVPAVALAQQVAKRFGISVHPRSIERALARKKKR